MNDFDKQRRTFNVMFKAVSAFIIVVFFCIIAAWITVGVYAVKASDQIETRGLKAIVEDVWCGKGSKCL